MYSTGTKAGGPGVYHFESLPVTAAPLDFFSDTKTQPSQEMREAMAYAPVGDEQVSHRPAHSATFSRFLGTKVG